MAWPVAFIGGPLDGQVVDVPPRDVVVAPVHRPELMRRNEVALRMTTRPAFSEVPYHVQYLTLTPLGHTGTPETPVPQGDACTRVTRQIRCR